MIRAMIIIMLPFIATGLLVSCGDKRVERKTVISPEYDPSKSVQVLSIVDRGIGKNSADYVLEKFLTDHPEVRIESMTRHNISVMFIVRKIK